MGLLRHRDEPQGTRFVMREKLMSIGDDSWIDDESGNHIYKVDGKAARIRDTFYLKDTNGEAVAKIQEKAISVRDKMSLEVGGRSATIAKNLVGLRDRFHVDVAGESELKAKGNFLDHEYEIERDGATVATVSKKWFRVRDTYGVEVAPGADVPLILAITVAIDSMTSVG